MQAINKMKLNENTTVQQFPSIFHLEGQDIIKTKNKDQRRI